MYYSISLSDSSELFFYIPSVFFILQFIFGLVCNRSIIKYIGFAGFFAYSFCDVVYPEGDSLIVAYSIIAFCITSSFAAYFLFPRGFDSLDLKNDVANISVLLDSPSFYIIILLALALHIGSMLYHGFSIENSWSSRIESSSGGAYYFRILFIFLNNYFAWALIFCFSFTGNFRFLYVFLLLIAGSIFTASRGAIVFPFIVLLFAFWRSSKKLFFYLFIFCVLGLPLLYIFGIIRNASQIGGEFLVSDIFNSDIFSIVPHFIEMLLLRISSLDDLFLFIPHVFDLTNPFRWLYSILAQPIPRVILDDKPFLFETYASQYSAPEIFEFGGSESVGLLGESLLSFHIFGPIIYGFIFVFVVRSFYLLFYKSFRSSILAWGSVLMLPFNMLTSGLLFGSATVQIIYSAIFCILLSRILRIQVRDATKMNPVMGG
jgi:hypothetical protein